MKIKNTIAVILTVFAFFVAGGSVIAAKVYSEAPAIEAALRQGSSGADVKTMQRKLKNWGYYYGAIDGIFGAQTKKAVIYFQRKNGLTPDGIVGEKTLKALGMSSSGSKTGTTSGSSNYTDSDVYLLARLIHSEARGETYTGQVAVGAVVLNRVKSPSFPNTISGVIYQSNAFTAVADGQINLAPDNTSIRAAKDALNGWDPSYGSLYYYNPVKSTNKWILSRRTVVTIGNHVFAI